jgi:transcriptional regulator with XRE-family HTH domain
MTAMRLNHDGSQPVSELAHELGQRIRTARIRRKIKQHDLAARTGLSRSSIQALERGELSVSLGIVLKVLWNLGLANEIALIADPGLDRDGLSLFLSSDKVRVFAPRKINNDF